MLRRTSVAVSFVLLAFLLMMEGMPDANAGSTLPDPINAGVADKLLGWIVVTRSHTTSRYGRRAKTSGAISNSRLLAGL